MVAPLTGVLRDSVGPRESSHPPQHVGWVYLFGFGISVAPRLSLSHGRGQKFMLTYSLCRSTGSYFGHRTLVPKRFFPTLISRGFTDAACSVLRGAYGIRSLRGYYRGLHKYLYWTYTIFGVPCYNYSIMGPKTLFFTAPRACSAPTAFQSPILIVQAPNITPPVLASPASL